MSITIYGNGGPCFTPSKRTKPSAERKELLMDPQELLDDFKNWSRNKQFNFIVELARDLTKTQLETLKSLIVTWLT